MPRDGTCVGHVCVSVPACVPRGLFGGQGAFLQPDRLAAALSALRVCCFACTLVPMAALNKCALPICH